MENIEFHIRDRRNYHRRRRNIIRRFFLVLLVVIYLVLATSIFLIPTHKPLKIEVINNLLIQTDYITSEVLSQVSGKNFFLIAPNKISNHLIAKTHLIEDIIIRKYLIPECKLVVYVTEKNIWAEILFDNRESKKRHFVTSEGDLIPTSYLNLNALPRGLLYIYSNQDAALNKSDLCRLKSIFDLVGSGMHLDISNFFLSDKHVLEINLGSGFKVRAGNVDSDLFKRVTKLKEALSAISQRSYKVEYIDLTLEGGAVFKKFSDDKKKTSIFRRKNPRN